MRVLVEVVDCAGVGVEDLANVLGTDLVLHPCRRNRDETFGLELVGVEEVADEGLRVVGLVGNVCENKHSGLVGEGLKPGGLHHLVGLSADYCAACRSDVRGRE